jgi:hypothetical protein
MKLAGEIANDVRNDPEMRERIVFLGIGTFEKAAIAHAVKKEVVGILTFSLNI